MPMLRLCGGNATTERPSMAMSPAVGASKPAINISVVVLPEPLGPSSVRNSPERMSSETPCTAPTLSNRFSIPDRTTEAPRGAAACPVASKAVPSMSGQDPLVPAADHRVAVVHPPLVIIGNQLRLYCRCARQYFQLLLRQVFRRLVVDRAVRDKHRQPRL